MTVRELREGLEVIRARGNGDPEASHAEADRLLLAYVSDQAPTREGLLVEKVYDEIDKWYA